MAVYSWGLGKFGQLGNGTKDDSPLPVPFKLSKKVGRPSQVHAGGLYVSVLTSHGDVYVAGCTKYGRTGCSTQNDITAPTKVNIAKDTKVANLSSGCWHSCFVSYLGRVYSAGYNSKHRVLGRDADMKQCPVPLIVSSLLPVTVQSVSCGHNFTLVTTNEGQVYSWGSGKYGVLGHGNEQPITTPTKISALNMIPIQSVSAGYVHCAAVSKDGRLFTWGKGSDGALGLGSNNRGNRMEPTWLCSADFLHVPVRTAACSQGEHKAHTLVLSQQGVVFSFGSNMRGCLGLGDISTRCSPHPVQSAHFAHRPIVAIAAGATHSAAVTGHSEYNDKPKTYHSLVPKRVVALHDTPAWKRGLRVTQVAASNTNTHVILQLI